MLRFVTLKNCKRGPGHQFKRYHDSVTAYVREIASYVFWHCPFAFRFHAFLDKITDGRSWSVMHGVVYAGLIPRYALCPADVFGIVLFVSLLIRTFVIVIDVILFLVRGYNCGRQLGRRWIICSFNFSGASLFVKTCFLKSLFGVGTDESVGWSFVYLMGRWLFLRVNNTVTRN